MQNIIAHLNNVLQTTPHHGFFITGTDTNIGKTYCAAYIVKALRALYIKPIQAGDLEKGGDTAFVKAYSGLDHTYFLDPIYALKHPLSPHEAAEKEHKSIILEDINMPKEHIKPLIVEGAGGVMVPINDDFFMIDLIKKFNLPVILVVRSQLGTLNHSLLTINALKSYHIPITALIMSGPRMTNNYQSLKKFTGIDTIFYNEW